jgi:glycine cleavage system H lipoate-binding protein
MVALLVLLTFAVCVALDYFVWSRARSARAPAWRELEPLTAARRPAPAGVFLQPTFTWSQVGSSGEVYVGVHPMLLGLVGDPLEFDCREPGERVAKGEPLVRVGRSGRRLTVRSPVAGRVEVVNSPPLAGRNALAPPETPDAPWLCRLLPDRLAEERTSWLSGDEAVEWTRRRYEDLRTYLHNAVVGAHLGTVMADGGEMPVGILAELDQGVWTGLADRFLAPEGTSRTPATAGQGPEGRP